MKIIGLNQNIIWKNIYANFALIERKFENEEADLFLLPEMFTTGFCMRADEIADVDGVTLSWMKSFSKNKTLQLQEAFL